MIKKLLFLLLALFVSQIFYAQDFDVENYNVRVTINKDGYFDVTEDYDVFFNRNKHGIYRDILLKYDLTTSEGTQEKRQIELSKIRVPGHNYEAPNKFERRLSNAARIKIGDADKYVNGEVNYKIDYRVKNAFLHSEEGVQFYWNLKPTDWQAEFKDMQFRIDLPDGVIISKEDVTIYSGYIGTATASTAFEYSVADGAITAKAFPGFSSNYGDAVTILVKMPPGSVKEIKPLWPFWSNYGWILLLTGIIGIFYALWKKYGKDDKVPTAISYFPPEGIDPAMAGFLIDDKQDTRDLISLIPHWGNRGLISITEIDKKGLFAKDDTEITKLKELPQDSPNYEKKLFKGMFGGSDSVLVSSLKDSFYKTMNSSKSLLKQKAQRYYEPRSKRVQIWVTVGLILLSLILVPTVLYFWGLLAAIAIVIVNLVLLVLNFFMIKKNTDGNAIFAELKGFRQFIKTAEERKLETLIKDSPNYYEDTMAYALTFGALKSWSRKFENLNVKPPSWYHTTSGGYHSMNSFSNSFSKTISSTSSTMVSTPSSSGSGGGSSGGGFGGGGGGSW